MEAFSLLGFTIKTLGEVMIGYAVIRVHNKMSQDKKIDQRVISEIKTEKTFTLIGIAFIIFGYLAELPKFLN